MVEFLFLNRLKSLGERQSTSSTSARQCLRFLIVSSLLSWRQMPGPCHSAHSFSAIWRYVIVVRAPHSRSLSFSARCQSSMTYDIARVRFRL